MIRIRMFVLALMLATGVAAADDTPIVQLRGQVVDGKTSRPVAGAQVSVIDAEGTERVVTSDRDGKYAVDVLPGAYEVAFMSGTSHTATQVLVEAGDPVTLNGTLESGEVIEVHDTKPPKVLPRPKNWTPHRAPPYSDKALLSDAWTRAWLLLDISSTGEVTRFKFLKRPGFDLEPIATAEVFRLKFEPAISAEGTPIAILVVWGIEWPSNGWLNTFKIPRTKMPPTVGFPPYSMSAYVPCKGEAPMNLESKYPTLRDCSKADLSRAPREPWVTRP